MKPIRRREFLKMVAAGVSAAALPRAARAAADVKTPDKPNFVIIFTDDQGYQDVGCFGSPDIKTPHLDKMAAEGCKFTDFYVAASVCSPSRAALLTGCYPPRVGITGVLFPRNDNGLNPQETTIAELLKARGYATACIGKWHLGHLEPFLPTNHGFDMYYGIPYSNDMWLDGGMKYADDAKLPEGVTPEDLQDNPRKKHRGVPLMRDEKVIEFPADQATLTRRYTEQAVSFIREHKDEPFFVYLPHTMPHVPLFAGEKFKGTSERGLYGDVIEEIDWSVGQILRTLRDLGLSEKTFVLFTSDNGPWLSKKKNGGSALPLRDGKFSVYEGGMREPTIAWWPGTVPAATTCDEPAGTIDLLPTLARLAGAKLPERTIDGKDIRALLTDPARAETPHRLICYYRGGRLAAVRSGTWKLHFKGGRKRGKAGEVELYDLSEDIGEKHNVAAGNPDVVKRLTEMGMAYDKSLKADARPAGKARR